VHTIGYDRERERNRNLAGLLRRESGELLLTLMRAPPINFTGGHASDIVFANKVAEELLANPTRVTGESTKALVPESLNRIQKAA